VLTSILAATDNHATDVNAGHLVTITMTTSESVMVTGTPTLQLNDNEVATYTKGSGMPVITSEVLSKSGAVTLTGTTGEANDTIAVYDGKTLLGTTTTSSDGTWSFATGTVSKTAVHTYTATATDLAGNIGHSSNEAILGSTHADSLVGTAGNDIIIGNGGNDTITGGLGADTLTGGSGKVTFIHNSVSDSTPSSHDTITDFNASRDKIDFTNIAGINAHHGIATFEGKLTGSGNLTLNAHSVAYIEVNGNTEVLVNTTNTAETVTSANVSAANMEIVLVGIHLGLKSVDFHHV
jgi:Ca2+-binding RTX toxin-like protein